MKLGDRVMRSDAYYGVGVVIATRPYPDGTPAHTVKWPSGMVTTQAERWLYELPRPYWNVWEVESWLAT